MTGDPDVADDSVTESRQHDQEEHGESLVRDSQQREPGRGGENENEDAPHPETSLERNSSESRNAGGDLDPAETYRNAVPRNIDAPPQPQRVDMHNTLPESIRPGEDSSPRSRMSEQEESQSNNGRLTMLESPPTPGYFRPEFPYEKRWKVHRAGMGLKRPKIKSIGRLNPEILRRLNRNTENNLTSQAVTLPTVPRMETATQISPPMLVSIHQHIVGVSEQTSPSNQDLNSTVNQGLHTPANEPVSIGNVSSRSLLSNNENNGEYQPEGADVQSQQTFYKQPVVASPYKVIQFPPSHQLPSELPCSSRQADERDQLFLRLVQKDEPQIHASPFVPDTTSKHLSEILNNTEQWAAQSTDSLDYDASPEAVESHDFILTTALLSEASRRLENMVKPSSSWQRDRTVLPPHDFQCESGPQCTPSPAAHSIKRKRKHDDSEVYGTKRRRLSPPLLASIKGTTSQQNVCEEIGTRRRRTSSATPSGRKRKRRDQNETDDSDEETKRKRT